MTVAETKTALVTGGNRGIGLAIVTALAAGGMRVLLGARDLEAGAAAAGTVEGDVEVVALDLASRMVTREQIDAVQRNSGPIDILVNNAGILPSGDVLHVAEEDFYRALRVNCEAPFDLIRALVPAMVERDYGRVVNVSSSLGAFDQGLDGPAAYAVSKAALNALTLSLARSVPETVKVNAVCPGWVRTRMGGREAHRSPEEGADTAVWLATLADDGPTGGFFRDRERIAW